jgi:hypothetical protein
MTVASSVLYSSTFLKYRASIAETMNSDVSGPHGNKHEDDCLQECCTMQSGRNWPAFQRKLQFYTLN